MCLRSRRTRNRRSGAFQLAQLANLPLPLPCPFWVVPGSAWVSMNTARRALPALDDGGTYAAALLRVEILSLKHPSGRIGQQAH